MRFPQPEPSFEAFLHNNRSFFIFFAIFWLPLAAMLAFTSLGEVVMWANARRTPLGDFIFANSTKLGEGYGYLIVIGSLLFVRFRSAITAPLVGLAVFLTSFTTKHIFAQARPIVHFKFSGEFELLKPLDDIFLNEGWNSFPSGHTMSAFALFGFLAFCLPHKRFLGPLAIVAATMVGLSRIYLLQHFLRDVVVGAVFGIIVAMLMYYLHFRFWPEKWTWGERKISGKVDS